MAKIYEFPNAEPAVNDGEQAVIDALLAGLPDDVLLIPNITVIDPKQSYECDVIVVTRDGVFIVETKDIAGSVAFREQEMVVSGQSRKNPYEQTRKKAQFLSTRLAKKLPLLRDGVWVEPLVVLARKPAMLEIEENLKNKVVDIQKAILLLSSPSSIVHPQRHNHIENKAREIAEAICFGSRPREKRDIFGDYLGLERLFGPPEAPFSAWRAEHQISKFEHVLEVHPRPNGLNSQGVVAWKSSLAKLYSAAVHIGPDRDVDLPTALFEQDNGSVVIVWSKRDYLPLHRFLEEVTPEDVLSSAKARSIVAGFAGAMQHLHVQGLIWGEIKPVNLVVRPNNRGAIVIDTPVPSSSVDTKDDVRQLREIINQICEVVEDELLSDILARLSNTKNSDEIPSAGWVASVCDGITDVVNNVIEVVGGDSFDARFIDQWQVSQHAFGKVYKAKDAISKQEVIVRVETGRPGESWTDLEFRALTHPKSRAAKGVVDVVSGGQSDRGSYVASPVLRGPSLASIIDAGGFREENIAVSVALELLATLKEIHPPIDEIQSMIARNSDVLQGEDVERMGVLRSAGIAHNLIDPTNIVLTEDRGPVLIDFVRSAVLGASIPIRHSAYWPDDLPLDVSDPSADIYSVGMILMAMLTGPLGKSGQSRTARLETIEARNSNLASVVKRATAETRNSRFSSASQFIDGLVALKIELVKIPDQFDIWEIQQKIEKLMAEGRFDEALKICAPEWEETRRSIERRRQAVIPRGKPIISIKGVELKFIGQRAIQAGTTGGNNPHQGGTALLYVVSVPGGGVLEVQVCSAVSEKGLETWVGGEAEYNIPPRMKKLARSLRMNVMSVANSEDLFVELSQARINPAAVDGNPTLKKSITNDDIMTGLGGADPVELFKSLRTIGYGTRKDVCGETNRNKGYLCVRFDRSNVHIPAVAHFATRVMPLYFALESKN